MQAHKMPALGFVLVFPLNEKMKANLIQFNVKCACIKVHTKHQYILETLFVQLMVQKSFLALIIRDWHHQTKV